MPIGFAGQGAAFAARETGILAEEFGVVAKEAGMASKTPSGLNGAILEKPPLDLLKGKVIQTGNFSFSLEELSKAGKVIDREGLTKAGRALDKHGNRPGSVFPKATGNVEARNIQGQLQLERILSDPDRKISTFEHRSLGTVIDIETHDKGGVRFSQNGEFIGFLQPDV